MGILYKIEFSNGKVYIGITRKTFRIRMNQHEAYARNGVKTPLYNAWRKHNDPECSILAIVENHMLAEIEIKAIKAFNSMTPFGYNCTAGGDGTTNYQHTDEHKKHMSKLMMGNNRNTEEVKQILSEKAKLRRHTEETKAKISASGKGKPAWNKGIDHHTEEYKAALSERMKGNKHVLGMKHTDESKSKMSIKSKGNKASLGLKWFNNGVIALTAKECPEGFIPGMLDKNLHWYNNGLINKRAKEQPEGFTPGRLKLNKIGKEK